MATALTNFAFTSSLSGFVCPTFYSWWLCPPPNACAHDADTGRIYCCNQQDTSVCWTISIECANDGSTLGCKNAGQTWCCVNEKETCITASGRYNVCFSKAQDILFDISAEALNATYSYLASASPSATSYTFDPAKLGAHATSSSTSISSTASTGSISTGTTASTAHPATSGQSTVTVVASTSNSPSLSGGAIGGIVAGAVIAVMIILGAIYLFLKRGRSQQAPPGPGAPLPGPAHIMPPPDRTLEAEWKPVYETGYTERPYEVEGLTKQVHEAGGLSSTRHELPGH